MAKAKPKIQDQGSAMERILGIRKTGEAAPVAQANPANTVVIEPQIARQPEENSAKEESAASKGRAAKKQPYVQTAFYITRKQHKALKIRAARGDNPKEKDMSAIARAALDAYLGL